MSNYNITFKNLRDITIAISQKREDVLMDFLNGFNGHNTFEKFRNILRAWENDVSYTLNLNLGDAPTRIQLSYIISELPASMEKKLVFGDGITEISISLPGKFENTEGILPFYDIIKGIKHPEYVLDLSEWRLKNRMLVIDNLPANIHTLIMNNILKDTSKIATFGNPTLKNFKFNFLTNEPYIFLKGLFSNYNEDYFRDIIFHLSKRIDGKILMDSTIMDIEYYVQKYSKELENQNSALTI